MPLCFPHSEQQNIITASMPDRLSVMWIQAGQYSSMDWPWEKVGNQEFVLITHKTDSAVTKTKS